MTLAQDEASSVIYGMNRVAIEAGSVQKILSVEAIAPTMIQLASSLSDLTSAGEIMASKHFERCERHEPFPSC